MEKSSLYLFWSYLVYGLWVLVFIIRCFLNRRICKRIGYSDRSLLSDRINLRINGKRFSYVDYLALVSFYWKYTQADDAAMVRYKKQVNRMNLVFIIMTVITLVYWVFTYKPGN